MDNSVHDKTKENTRKTVKVRLATNTKTTKYE